MLAITGNEPIVSLKSIEYKYQQNNQTRTHCTSSWRVWSKNAPKHSQLWRSSTLLLLGAVHRGSEISLAVSSTCSVPMVALSSAFESFEHSSPYHPVMNSRWILLLECRSSDNWNIQKGNISNSLSSGSQQRWYSTKDSTGKLIGGFNSGALRMQDVELCSEALSV